MSAPGADMARFMIAHLHRGRLGDAAIMQPETVDLMHRRAYQPAPPLNGMTLGFYEEDRNGRRIIGHIGDTRVFHSDMHLFIDDDIGLFVSFTGGVNGMPGAFRRDLLRGFTDRYFPAADEPAPALATARQHGLAAEGRYLTSLRSETNFLSLLNLQQAEIRVDEKGFLTVSSLKGANGEIKHWRETAPFIWTEDVGPSRLAMVRDKDGRITAFRSDDHPPYLVLTRVDPLYSAAWNVPLLLFSTTVSIIAAGWPIAAILRRRRGTTWTPTKRRRALVRRLAMMGATLNAAVALGWLILSVTVGNNVALFDDRLDPFLAVLGGAGLVGLLSFPAALANAWAELRDVCARWFGRFAALLLAAASAGFCWFYVAYNLICPGSVY